MVDLDELGVLFADECQQQGVVGFCLRTNEDGGVRLIGLRLPTKAVARMLRAAADGYEEQVSDSPLN